MSDKLHDLFSNYLKKIYLEAAQKDIPEKEIEKDLDDFIKLYGNEFLKSLYKGMYEAVAEHHLLADEFTINLEKKWFRVFVVCDAVNVATDEILSDYI